MGTLHLNWLVGDVEVAFFSGFLESESHQIGDQDNTDLPLAIIDVQTDFGEDFNATQYELRISGSAFDNWEWTVGGYYQDTDSQTDVVVDQHIVGTGVFPFTLDIPIESEISAIFTHNTIALGPDTELTVGARYNNFKQDAGNIQSGDFWFGSELLPGGEITDPVFIIPNAFSCFDGQTPPCALGSDYDEDEWTGTIKLAHFFSEELHVYGTLDRGYRPGAANFDTTGVFTPEFNAYGGEKVNSIEIGAKGDLFDGRARYTAAVFYSEYEDYQVQVALQAYNTITGEVETATNPPWVNVDEAVQQGFEADFKMLVTENWSFYTGMTYSNVEFTDGEVPCNDPSQPPVGPSNRFNTCDADGEVASAQPEWSGVLQSEYVWPSMLVGSDLYISGIWNYKGEIKVPGDTAGRLESDSYSTVDFYAGLRNESWTLQAFVKNAHSLAMASYQAR